MNRPTPETDAVVAPFIGCMDANNIAERDALLDHARKLECERDEARRDALNCRQIIDTYSRQEDDLLKAIAERDQLRTVADELAEALNQDALWIINGKICPTQISAEFESGGSLTIGQVSCKKSFNAIKNALTAYNQLPRRKETK